MPFSSAPSAARPLQEQVATARRKLRRRRRSADARTDYFLFAGAFLAGFFFAVFFAAAFFAGFFAALANVLLLSMESRESAHARILVQVSS